MDYRAFVCGIIFALVLQTGGTDVPTAEVKPLIAPPAKWVVPQFFERLSKAGQIQPGEDQRLLLSERQINAADNETFFHTVRQILTVAGVQNGATVSVDFDPTYQSVTFHWLRIWRGTNHLDRLNADKIKTIQPERDLEQAQFNGKKSALLVLEDVRVGDLIDCAWSLGGANPVFGGRFTAVVAVQLNQPVERLLTRVIWPSPRRLYAKNHRSLAQAAVTSKKGTVEYVWDFRQVPGLHREDSLPVWYDPEPWVQLSEFQTWAEVNQWALALFQNAAPLSPELLQKIAEWRRLPSREQQVLTVLRFVQDEVRYFGIELGAGSHQPSNPSLVFSRRFGDCKDKSLLFVAMLRHLGIESYPVLVNTELRGTIADWLPSANAFDHCIAQVQCDGQAYWLDPTAGYQRGSLTAHYLPGYERGLVVAPRTTGLTAVPQRVNEPQTTTTEYFQLGRKNESTDLKVVTVAEGRDADNMRAYFATAKRSDIEKSYLHVYADLYPGIKATAPVEIVDDKSQNRVETTEFYTIDRVWTPSETDGKFRCEFYPYAIATLLRKPTDTERTMPVGVPFPQHQFLRTEVTLPEIWPPDGQNKTISDPAFYFQKNFTCRGNRLVMEWEYRSVADSVPANRSPEFIQHLNDASKALGYSLSWR